MHDWVMFLNSSEFRNTQAEEHTWYKQAAVPRKNAIT